MEFSDFVAAGLALMATRDHTSWELGDLAVAFEVTIGRPSDDDEGPTLGDLAAGWNVSAHRVSEWRSVSAFYPVAARTYDVPWEIYNMARRASNGSLDNALELLDYAQQQAFTVAAFRRYLKGVRWEGKLRRHDLPPWLQGILPPFEQEYWVEIKRAGEGE